NPRVDAMMVAQVVYPSLDPEGVPASLSRAICTDLLRTSLGFEGVLFTDDLEMKAIAIPIGEAAVRAINAGCAGLLVCRREALAEEVHAALVREAESSPAFKSRCEEAHARFATMRRRVPSRPSPDDAAAMRVFETSRAIAAELSARMRVG